jgi:hypothetical protein
VGRREDSIRNPSYHTESYHLIYHVLYIPCMSGGTRTYVIHDKTHLTISISYHGCQEAYGSTGREKLAAAEAASAAQESAGVVSNGLVTETIYSLRKGECDGEIKMERGGGFEEEGRGGCGWWGGVLGVRTDHPPSLHLIVRRPSHFSSPTTPREMNHVSLRGAGEAAGRAVGGPHAGTGGCGWVSVCVCVCVCSFCLCWCLCRGVCVYIRVPTMW